jgi:hypothetical protein
MFSLRTQLEQHAGDLKHEIQQINDKYTKNSKEYFDAFIKLTIDGIKPSCLFSSPFMGDGAYYVFVILTGQVVFKNVPISNIRIDDVVYHCDFSTSSAFVEKGIDVKNKTINVYYIFNIIKKYINSIEDVKPIIDEDTYKIYYRWDVSVDNKSTNRMDILKHDILGLERCIENFGDEDNGAIMY